MPKVRALTIRIRPLASSWRSFFSSFCTEKISFPFLFFLKQHSFQGAFFYANTDVFQRFILNFALSKIAYSELFWLLSGKNDFHDFSPVFEGWNLVLTFVSVLFCWFINTNTKQQDWKYTITNVNIQIQTIIWNLWFYKLKS